MANEPTTEAVKSGLSWLTLASKALSVIESLLPAFFVAWNNSIRQKNQALQQQVRLMEVKLAEVSEKPACHDSSRTAIDSFLGRK
jgi:hypothetical protein